MLQTKTFFSFLLAVTSFFCSQIVYGQIDSSNVAQTAISTKTVDSSSFKSILSTSTDTTKINDSKEAFLIKHGNWIFPSLSTILSVLILVWLGSWAIGKKLSNLEALHSLQTNKYQWKYELLKSITKQGFLSLASSTQFADAISEYSKNIEDKELAKSLEDKKTKWYEGQCELQLLLVQAGTIFNDKTIHADLSEFIKLQQNIEKIAETIRKTNQSDFFNIMREEIRKIQQPLLDAINKMSREILQDFSIIEKRISKKKIFAS